MPTGRSAFALSRTDVPMVVTGVLSVATHLVDWVAYHSGRTSEPSPRPASLTYWGPSAGATECGDERRRPAIADGYGGGTPAVFGPNSRAT
jgi:hypothetical protein